MFLSINFFSCRKAFGNKNRTQNYHVLPTDERYVFRNEQEGSLVGKYLWLLWLLILSLVKTGIQNKDDDDDVEPLAL